MEDADAPCNNIPSSAQDMFHEEAELHVMIFLNVACIPCPYDGTSTFHRSVYAMARLSTILSSILCLTTALAVQLQRQAAAQYTNSSSTALSVTSSALGDFCCQIYAPIAFLNYWYTGPVVEDVNATIVTEFLRYNNTVTPTATVTRHNRSATIRTGKYNAAGGQYRPIVPGVPADLNGPTSAGRYDQTVILTETEMDYGYTIV